MFIADNLRHANCFQRKQKRLQTLERTETNNMDEYYSSALLFLLLLLFPLYGVVPRVPLVLCWSVQIQLKSVYYVRWRMVEKKFFDCIEIYYEHS